MLKEIRCYYFCRTVNNQNTSTFGPSSNEHAESVDPKAGSELKLSVLSRTQKKNSKNWLRVSFQNAQKRRLKKFPKKNKVPFDLNFFFRRIPELFFQREHFQIDSAWPI